MIHLVVRLVVLGAVTTASLFAGNSRCPAQQNYFYPDLIPFVREDQPYLQNWFIDDDQLLVETLFANIGDGLLQLRLDRLSATVDSADVYQRVFINQDNGPQYEQFLANRSIFHPTHGHFHFEDFALFELLSVNHDDDGNVTVGQPVAESVKTSFLIHDSMRLPDPQWADAPSYPSFNFASHQNVSVGHGDVYSHFTDGQAIGIAGVPRGPLYWLRQTVDPTNVLRETDETNNSFEILIDLTRPETAIRHPYGTFVQPGDFHFVVPADLTGDAQVTIDDWLMFQFGVGSPLDGLSDVAAYQLGDLNLDGTHSPADFILFKHAYENANGAGAFASLDAGVPEPHTIFMCLIFLFLFGLPKQVSRTR